MLFYKKYNHNRRMRKAAVVVAVIVEMIILFYSYENLLCMRHYENHFRQFFPLLF